MSILIVVLARSFLVTFHVNPAGAEIYASFLYLGVTIPPSPMKPTTYAPLPLIVTLEPDKSSFPSILPFSLTSAVTSVIDVSTV